jgi:uncharacterized protein YraI
VADADGPDFFRVTGLRAGDVLNIRSAPAASAPKVGAIPHDGNGIRNLGCKGGLTFAQWEKATPAQRAAARFDRWCRIEFNGMTGWAAGRYLTEGKASVRHGERLSSEESVDDGKN